MMLFNAFYLISLVSISFVIAVYQMLEFLKMERNIMLFGRPIHF